MQILEKIDNILLKEEFWRKTRFKRVEEKDAIKMIENQAKKIKDVSDVIEALQMIKEAELQYRPGHLDAWIDAREFVRGATGWSLLKMLNEKLKGNNNISEDIKSKIKLLEQKSYQLKKLEPKWFDELIFSIKNEYNIR